jgi:hypothetical protein
MEETSVGKTRKKTAEQFQVILSSEFYGSHDSWTEYLCLARNPDGSITLTSRAREILAEAGRYREKDYLPAAIKRKEVWGFDGDYVVGMKFLPHDAGAAVTVSQTQFDVAAEWLIGRKWDRQPEFGQAWARIRFALYGPEFFSPANPLPLLGSAVGDRQSEGPKRHGAGSSDDRDGGPTPQFNGRKPREIVIRCAGPSRPWFVWAEVVFLEWSRTSYSVYARSEQAIPGGAESPGLMPRTQGRLSWRTVLEFVRSHDLAAISRTDPKQIDIYGVRPWHRDVMAAAIMGLSTIVPFLSSLTEKELRSLHKQLGGFLSNVSAIVLSQLAAVLRSPLLADKSLAEVALLVGSPDAMDAGKLAADCTAYLDDRRAEATLAQHRNTAAPSVQLFLSLLCLQAPRNPKLRAGLFELWLRTDPKPKGGAITGMNMDNELPVLHWLLWKQVAEVFQDMIRTRRSELQEFVSWFLDKARAYTEYFTGGYKFGSFNVYAHGRPRYAAWARLAQEIQDAATNLGIPFPEELRLPAMPDLEEPTRAFLVTSSTGISHRHLKRIAEQLCERDPGKQGSDS